MPGRARAVVIAIGIVAVLVLGAVLLPSLMRPMVIGRIQSTARQRGMNASWSAMHFTFPARAAFDDLVVTRLQGGDTVLTARTLQARVSPWSVLRARPEIAALRIQHATLQVGTRSADLPDTTFDEKPGRRDDPARLARVRRSAASIAQMLTRSNRALPGINFENVTVRPAPGADQLWGGVHLDRLDHLPTLGGSRAVIAGTLLGDAPVPFHGSLERTRDQRVRGTLEFAIPNSAGGQATPLRIALDAALAYGRAPRAVELKGGSHVRIGDIDLRLAGRVEEGGPRFTVQLAADSLSESRVKSSLPPATLGPLTGLAVRGTFDYRLDLDLDLAQPDSTRFRADVIPHGLALDPMRSTLRLTGLDQPFIAHIHLPRGRIVDRDLSAANPHFRPLGEITSALAMSVVTNEDGGFFRHRGFNTGAVQEAIGENLRSASFRRGAGTITMQIARNLWLGHERTLARKGQEVVLAWMLEHLTGLPKERLLEIYLNIIEWGPNVHGADEAANFYFDRDAGHLSLSESLFLATLVPSPGRWRQRFDANGELRPYVKSQMHFIGRAMVAKGWLSPEALPPSEELGVELYGPAHRILFPDEEPEMVAEPNLLRRLWTRVSGGR